MCDVYCYLIYLTIQVLLLFFFFFVKLLWTRSAIWTRKHTVLVDLPQTFIFFKRFLLALVINGKGGGYFFTSMVKKYLSKSVSMTFQ